MATKKKTAEITDEVRKAWADMLKATVHPNDNQITDIDSIIPRPEEVKVTVEEKVEVHDPD